MLRVELQSSHRFFLFDEMSRVKSNVFLQNLKVLTKKQQQQDVSEEEPRQKRNKYSFITDLRRSTSLKPGDKRYFKDKI